MDIKKSTHEITINSQEAYSIALALKTTIRKAIDTHWVSHLDADWRQSEKEELYLMKHFYAMSTNDFYEEELREFEAILDLAKKKANIKIEK